VDYFFLPPVYSLLDHNVEQNIRLGLFVLEGVVICVLIARAQSAMRRLGTALAENERLLAEAREANRAKDAFLAMLSHELRTPMNTIVGWAHMLQSPTLEDAQVAKALEVISRNALLQARLLDDLIDVARLVTGKMEIKLQTVRLSETVRAVVDGFAPQCEERGITIKVAVQDAFPLVTGDPERLHQVVGNLISNAVKFSPDGGSIEVEVRRAEPSVEIAVTDHGPGVAPDVMSKLFEPFWQGEEGRNRGGLGLGLPIAKHIIEIHGGTIHVQRDSQGTTFTISLPA
jgi:signal transduction histidine kinase